MAIGYDSPLYVLPFDHRATFSKTMFGWEGPLGPGTGGADRRRQGRDLRRLQGGRRGRGPQGEGRDPRGRAVRRGHPARRPTNGFITACPAEKSGQDEFDFEYGADFARHIEEFDPTFCKVLVRYNPEGDAELNRRQAARLKQLSDYLHASGRLYMFELLVPPRAGPAASVSATTRRPTTCSCAPR